MADFGLAVQVSSRRGGEIGRRTGLKILGSERDVPVRFRSSAPFLHLILFQKFRDFLLQQGRGDVVGRDRCA